MNPWQHVWTRLRRVAKFRHVNGKEVLYSIGLFGKLIEIHITEVLE